jgi:hypothetical protein
MHKPPDRPHCPDAAPVICYALLRHVGAMLDELSTQGIDLWRDDQRAWRWRWLDTDLQAHQGMRSFGEALVDAVITRYPDQFQPPAPEFDDGVTR